MHDLFSGNTVLPFFLIKLKVNIGEVCANSATVETTFSGGNGASVISMKITKY